MPEQVVYTLPEAGEQAAPQPVPEGVYVHNPNMVDEASELWIEFFRKPRWLELTDILVGEVQELEDAYWDMHLAFDVDTAEGHQLDLLGKRVGELRDGRVDDDYRAAVRTRILVNSSDGKLDQLYAIILSMLPDATVRAWEFYPAKLRLDVYDSFAGATPTTVARLVRQAKAGGVGLIFVAVDTDETLIWGKPAPNGWGAKWARRV